MTGRRLSHRMLAAGCALLVLTGCSFDGLNSLALPGAKGRGPGAEIYHVEIANVVTLEPNSPVLSNDVVVGSIGEMRVKDGHADVLVSVRPGTVIPANAVATVGQTSLLGSMHLQLNTPLGEAPSGRLQPGSTLALNRSSTYPSTEQTLSALSLVVNGGGLGQVGDIIHNFNAAFSGREPQVRELLGRLDTFIGTLDAQRDNIIASIEALNRLATTFAEQRDVIDRALRDIPPALDVLVRERPRITAALDKLGHFSDTASRVVNESQADLVKNLQNLEPVIRVLGDFGSDLDFTLAALLVYPYTQGFIDRGVRGDYMNLFAVMDLTIPRLKRTMFLGTRWGQQGAPLVPAPGDPFYLNYSYDPLASGVAPPPPEAQAPGGQDVPAAPVMPPVTEPLLPVSPPAPLPDASAGAAPETGGIFAGPYPAPAVGPNAPAIPGGG